MINKDTEIYCSFAKKAGNVGCKVFNTAFRYYDMNKIYKSFSVDNIESAVNSVKTLNIKGFERGPLIYYLLRYGVAKANCGAPSNILSAAST